MIRINLLTSAGDRPAGSGRRRWTWLALGGGLAAAAATAALVGWWSSSLRGEAAAVSQGLAAAEAALGRLAPIVARVQEAEARQADLGGRIALLDDLHARRGASVRMLDRLSRLVPPGLWFTEVREESAGVVVRGYAATLATVADYAAALEAPGAFGTPIEIVDSQRDDGSGGRRRVRFEFRIPFPEAGYER